ncbi:translesion DNA synthesis-associated protein ImuA [Veronia pacifica]|uniref:Recombinase RecA n=1 Tax=Veronia pacifica TaxID=1080227 RepID=A0A1C3EIN9_9GAMM|nr:translesion DNA synthesis-associated protein ImuA [Veronia pacifica]ODA33097.1 hypothetical protein A8L45_11710 [Veronia pacifica]
MLKLVSSIHPAVWKGSSLQETPRRFVSTGIDQLDQYLEGGWPEYGAVECCVPFFGFGELSLLLPALKNAQKKDHISLLVAAPGDLHPLCLHRAGLDLSKTVCIQSEKKMNLWALEQALKSGSCQAAVYWNQGLSFKQARRLQIAASENNCQLFLISLNDGSHSLPLPFRARLSPVDNKIRFEVFKRRGSPLPPVFIESSRLRNRLEQHHDLFINRYLAIKPNNVFRLR